MRFAIVLVALAVASAADATARQLPLDPGQRVRVTAPAAGFPQTSGNYQHVERDTLLIHVPQPQAEFQRPLALHIALDDVTQLEAFRGRRTSAYRVLMFAGGGTLLGAGVGWLVKSAVGECDGTYCFGEARRYAPLIGAVAGFSVGALVGSVWKRDRWEEVPLDDLRVSVVPVRNGVGLGASVAF